MRMLYGDEPLPKGIIHHSKRHPDNIKKVAVTCLLCGRERFVLIPRGKQREKEGFTGACHSCAMGFRKEEWKHSSGALVLWGKRIPGQRHLVPFICINCGEEKVVGASQVYSTVKKWTGWCSDCIEARGSHRKFREDKELQPWGSWVLFSQRTSTHIPVRCGLCGRTRMMSEGSVLANWQRGMTGYCPDRFACNKARLESAEANEQSESIGANFHADTVQRLRDVPKLLDEIKPLVLEAKQLAKRHPLAWRSEVEREFPHLTSEAVSMLPTEPPNKIAWEQVARTRFGCSGRTLRQKFSEAVRGQAQQT